jgi:Ca2+-binding RTX toxin-like protein
MRRGASRRRAWPLVLLAVVLVTGTAFTAANVVAGSRAGMDSETVTANQLKPSECATLDLAVVRGPAPGGGNANALIVGTSASESINGNGGNDCILGGGGNDTLRGNGGSDVCGGGTGTDAFHRCCEVQVQ